MRARSQKQAERWSSQPSSQSGANHSSKHDATRVASWNVMPPAQFFSAVGSIDCASRSSLFAPAEMIIHPGAHDVIMHRDVVRRRSAAIETAIELAEIGVKIFGFGCPVARQRDFDAAADGPARIGGARSAKAGRGSADVAYCQSAGHIRHDAAKGVAGTPAHGREPAVAGATARAEHGAARPLE